jgi:riboflavin-specific deaminase-like protein
MAWEIILRIREELKRNSLDCESFLIETTASSVKKGTSLMDEFCRIEILLTENKPTSSDVDIVIACLSPFSISIDYLRPVTELDQRLLELYLPYVFLPFFARKLKKTFVITHFAQTLDGRIASITGDSKWIGNQQNLIHAHRMRALVDGIIIGAKTLAVDNPRLTVRHVEGNNPSKILIGGDKLDIDKFNLGKGEIIIFSKNNPQENEKIITYSIDRDKDYFKTKNILEILYQSGITSVYIEGGSITTSAFLEQGMVDQVQIHFAPIILGSGITGFKFQGVNSLKDGIHFRSFRFHPIGDQMMFVGEIS